MSLELVVASGPGATRSRGLPERRVPSSARAEERSLSMPFALAAQPVGNNRLHKRVFAARVPPQIEPGRIATAEHDSRGEY